MRGLKRLRSLAPLCERLAGTHQAAPAAELSRAARQYAAAAVPEPVDGALPGLSSAGPADPHTGTAATEWHRPLLPGADSPVEPSLAQKQAHFLEAKGILLTGTPLYLDMQATTPMDPRVLDRMLPFLTEQYGNPHSRTHYFGWESEDAVEVARKQVCCQLPRSRALQHVLSAHRHAPGSRMLMQALVQVAQLVGADPREIIFTSGATEANNMAIKGVAGFYKDKKHLITTQTDRARPCSAWRAVGSHRLQVALHGSLLPDTS